MLRLSYFISLILIASFAACNGNEKEKEEQKKEEIESLKAEVIGVHDEVMPKMDKIMRLKGQLERESLTINDSTSADTTVIVRNIIKQLEEADAAMMVWMRNYDPMMEDMSHEEKLLYLEQEKKDIEQVREQMLSAISEAEGYLEEK